MFQTKVRRVIAVVAVATVATLSVTIAPPATADDIAGSGWMHYRSLNSVICLAVAGGSPAADGAHLVQYQCINDANHTNELFYAEQIGYDSANRPVYRIHPWYNGTFSKCVTDDGYSSENGTVMVQWACQDGNTAQEWGRETDVLTTSWFRNESSGKYLSVSGDSHDDNASIVQWDFNGQGNQLWTPFGFPS